MVVIGLKSGHFVGCRAFGTLGRQNPSRRAVLVVRGSQKHEAYVVSHSFFLAAHRTKAGRAHAWGWCCYAAVAAAPRGSGPAPGKESHSLQMRAGAAWGRHSARMADPADGYWTTSTQGARALAGGGASSSGARGGIGRVRAQPARVLLSAACPAGQPITDAAARASVKGGVARGAGRRGVSRRFGYCDGSASHHAFRRLGASHVTNKWRGFEVTR